MVVKQKLSRRQETAGSGINCNIDVQDERYNTFKELLRVVYGHDPEPQGRHSNVAGSRAARLSYCMERVSKILDISGCIIYFYIILRNNY